MTTAALEKELIRRVEKVSEEMGINKRELKNRALLLYLESVQKQMDLFRELAVWDRLSDDAFAGLKF